MKFGRSPAWASKKPRTWWKRFLVRSRKAFPRRRPKPLPNSLQRQAQLSRSNKDSKFVKYRESAASAGSTGRFPIFYILAAYQREVMDGQGLHAKLIYRSRLIRRNSI